MFQSETCSLHCGYLQGVSKDRFEAEKSFLQSLFSSVQYYETSGKLHVCGARNLADDPEQFITLFNRLSSLLNNDGKGSLLVKCEDSTEVCYMRRKRWKLAHVVLPPDPFEGVYYAD